MPCHLSEGLSGRLIPTSLKAKRFSSAQRLAGLKRVGKRLRPAWPDTWGILRGDSHFASPEVMAWREAHPPCAMSQALRATRCCSSWPTRSSNRPSGPRRVGGARRPAFTRRAPRREHGRARRVVIKVEVSEQGVTTRCGVTDREHARTPVLYRHISCARGHMENESKDPKLSLQAARTSCHRFEANQVRVFVHSAASMLLDTLRRDVCRTTPWACAPMETIPWRCLKPGHFPALAPGKPVWRQTGRTFSMSQKMVVL